MLRELAATGVGAAAIAEVLERSEQAVRDQASRQRVSVRRSGERRGLILGERRAARFEHEVRTAVLIGVVDPADAERRARRSGDLCPSCSSRYASTRSGFCEPCHLRRLAEAHREELAIIAGRRELDAARALKYRARRQSR